jgi:hypothetical protein
VLALRKYSVAERVSVLIKAVEAHRPDLIIVDGGVDFLNDFNNPDESKFTIGLLMRLSSEYNCHIINIMHQGKGNGELRGHFGAESLNKSETVFQISKDGNTVTVTAGATRNQPFDDFSFIIGDNGIPMHSETEKVPKMSANERKADKLKLAFAECFADGKTLSFTELRTRYMEAMDIGKTAAYNAINFADNVGLIYKTANGNYYIKT